MSGAELELEWIAGRFAVCRLPATAEIPQWVPAGGGLISITRTDGELSIVAMQDAVPADVQAERDWVAMRIVGKLGFSAVGVLAKLCGALAGASVGVLAISTYETDILLVKSADAQRAARALGAVADVARLGGS
ncbi:MAG: ACT domain-containing protein [Planctomycetes bacterium]|nr:ACT domain-containing protein [Planctomycetota bacterium]